MTQRNTIEGFFKYADKIIHAASQSPLGIVALTVLVIAVIGIIFFRKDGVRVRISIFVLLFLGLGLLVWAVLRPGRSSEKEESKAFPVPVNSPFSNSTETPAPLPKQTPSARLVPPGIRRLSDESKSTPTPPPTSKSITNSPIINSPGSVQNTGDNVTINQGSQPRVITGSRRAQMLEILRTQPKGTVEVDYAFSNGEAFNLAKQVVEVLATAGWDARLGSPGAEGMVQTGLGIFVHSASTPGAGALQAALNKAGFPTRGIENPELPKQHIGLFVGPKPD